MSNLGIYLQPKIITILLLGFSSGLPRLLIASTLGAWLADSGIERATIGLFAYVALPYSFNFIWAPIIDHLRVAYLTDRLGRRKSWMILSQIALMICLILMSIHNPADEPFLIAFLALLVAFFSASQDIVIDAYRTEYLPKKLYGEGATVAVFGYRLGMLFAGAGALAMADISAIGWQITYLVMAGLMLVGMITIILADEPDKDWRPEKYHNIGNWLEKSVIAPFVNFAKTHEKWLLILIFIALYRMSDGFIGFMATPFMMDIGFSKTEIATIGKLYGFGATIVGSILGAIMLHKIGMFRSLMLFGICQLVTNLAYVVLAYVGTQQWALMLAITCDNLAGGMVTIAAIAFMMRLCNQKYTATQYALLSSLASLASITLAGTAGIVAQEYGWVAMFSISSILGIPSLVILCMIGKKHPAMKDT